ncbi:MAG: hypothetical protein KBA86_09130, partial [Bacteroidales bacterium]|nr:hypothetical protein [Bacteroidales bacterium]
CYIVLLYSVTIGKESENNLLFIYRRNGFNWKYVRMKFFFKLLQKGVLVAVAMMSLKVENK